MPISHAHLRAFHAVAEHGSFTRAAEALHVTQPTLSGQVRELEARYHVKLFTRYGRRVSLTDLGHSTLEITRRLFRAEQEAEQLFLAARGLSEGQLTVGADSPYIITPLVANYQRRYPGVRISLRYGNTAELLKWLKSQRCDIAILANIPGKIPPLNVVKLKPDHLVVFVNQQHPWAGRQSISMQEIIDQRVILREKGSHTRSIFEKALAKAGQRLQDIMEIDSREGVREAVGAGLGVGIVSSSELGADTRFHTLKVKDAKMTHSEYMITLQNREDEQPVRAFIDMVADLIR